MSTALTTLCVRSYASDTASDATSDAPQWTLFVRQQTSDSETVFVFTVVTRASDAPTCAVYERRLGRDAIDQHIEELGIEVQAPAFVELLMKTLATRKSVAVVMDEDDEEETDSAVCVMLTYKFSETISRKGQVVLDCVAKDVPLAVATLLQDIHAVQNESVMTEAQKLQKQLSSVSAGQAKTKTASITASSTSSMSLSLSQESNLSTDGEAAVAPATVNSTATVNPQLLKRRHVPTGTVRRKGPRGAKLAKTE